MSNYPPQYPPHHHQHDASPQPFNPHQPYSMQGQSQSIQTAQPGFRANMNARGDHLNASGAPFKGPNGRREWSHGLCGFCARPGIWCAAIWCPCVVYSKNKTRLDHVRQYGRRHPQKGESCTGDCFLHGCLSMIGVGWILQIGSREEVRNHYRIEGGACGDCMAAWCCPSCELTQEAREIELEEDFQGDQHGLLLAGAK